MKIHSKKKQFRSSLKKLCKEGYANLADGRMVMRSSLPDNAMRRDFSPQSGKG